MVAAAGSPKKAAAKKSTKGAAKPALHPPYGKMVVSAVVALKERGGSSRQKITKYVLDNFKGLGDDEKAKGQVKRGLKRALAAGTLVHTKGTGASGSFKVPAPVKVKAEPKKKVVKKKPAAKPKTVKTAAAKSPAKKKAAKAKKATPKKAAAKSPKKVKKVTKKAAPKARKSPAKKSKAKK